MWRLTNVNSNNVLNIGPCKEVLQVASQTNRFSWSFVTLFTRYCLFHNYCTVLFAFLVLVHLHRSTSPNTMSSVPVNTKQITAPVQGKNNTRGLFLLCTHWCLFTSVRLDDWMFGTMPLGNHTKRARPISARLGRGERILYCGLLDCAKSASKNPHEQRWTRKVGAATFRSAQPLPFRPSHLLCSKFAEW